jgi:hypothetical protein
MKKTLLIFFLFSSLFFGFVNPVFANPALSPVNDGLIKCLNYPDNWASIYQVRWGYNNSSNATITEPIGTNNNFNGASDQNMGQPTEFLPGRIVNTFRTTIAPEQVFVWKLGNKTATASVGSTFRERECF